MAAHMSLHGHPLRRRCASGSGRLRFVFGCRRRLALSAFFTFVLTVWRFVRVPFWIALGTTVGFLVPYLVYLDSQIRSRFDDLSWDLPSRVYARALELRPGAPMSAEALTLELEAARYSVDAAAKVAGSY